MCGEGDGCTALGVKQTQSHRLEYRDSGPLLHRSLEDIEADSHICMLTTARSWVNYCCTMSVFDRCWIRSDDSGSMDKCVLRGRPRLGALLPFQFVRLRATLGSVWSWVEHTRMSVWVQSVQCHGRCLEHDVIDDMRQLYVTSSGILGVSVSECTVHLHLPVVHCLRLVLVIMCILSESQVGR